MSNEELKPQGADDSFEAAVDAYREWEAVKWDGEQYASDREARRLVLAIRDALEECGQHRRGSRTA